CRSGNGKQKVKTLASEINLVLTRTFSECPKLGIHHQVNLRWKGSVSTSAIKSPSSPALIELVPGPVSAPLRPFGAPWSERGGLFRRGGARGHGRAVVQNWIPEDGAQFPQPYRRHGPADRRLGAAGRGGGVHPAAVD